eukprot:Awhi_evm4s5900
MTSESRSLQLADKLKLKSSDNYQNWLLLTEPYFMKKGLEEAIEDKECSTPREKRAEAWSALRAQGTKIKLDNELQTLKLKHNETIAELTDRMTTLREKITSQDPTQRPSDATL